MIGIDDPNGNPVLLGSLVGPPDLSLPFVASVVHVRACRECVQHLGRATDMVRMLVRDPDHVDGSAAQGRYAIG